jgi:hypothetical protein
MTMTALQKLTGNQQVLTKRQVLICFSMPAVSQQFSWAQTQIYLLQLQQSDAATAHCAKMSF